LYISEEVLKGCAVGGEQNGEDFIMRDRVVTSKRRVLMSTEELRRLLHNTKCSHSRRNAYGRKLTARIEFYKRIHTGGDC
jgi:hypothetical protein